MKRKMSTILLTVLSLSGVSGCGNNPAASGVSPPAVSTHDQSFIEKLDKLQQKDPFISARKAIASGKPYFLCNIGRSRTVPGLNPEVYAQGSANCPTRCLEGVTDAVYGPHHARYLEAAMNFSIRWNQVMIEACR